MNENDEFDCYGTDSLEPIETTLSQWIWTFVFFAFFAVLFYLHYHHSFL